MALDWNPWKDEGLCRAEATRPGRFCLKPATWLATKADGWAMGFCDKCKESAPADHGFVSWEKVEPPQAFKPQRRTKPIVRKRSR